MFDYVPKEEYEPVKVKIEDILKIVKGWLKKFLTFRYELIGSGKANLITRKKDGSAFDLDYNLCLKDIFYELDDCQLREIFYTAFKYLENYFNNIEIKRSRRVITLIFYNETRTNIIASCDLAITCEVENEERDTIQQVLIMDRVFWQDTRYIWNESRNDAKYYILAKEIARMGYWEDLKELYLEKKNENEYIDKMSHSLFAEAVNEIYNKIKEGGISMAKHNGVSSNTHTQQQRNDYSNQRNSNNQAHQSNNNNHSNQLNPNNGNYKGNK